MTADRAREYLDHLAAEGRSQNTLAAYRRDLKRYAEFLAANDVAGPEEATAALLETLPLWLEQEAGYSQRSAARIVAAVRGLHRWLDGSGGLGPARELRVADRRPPARVLSADDMAALVDVGGISDLAARDRALLELLYAAGARSTEAAALTLRDVDLDEATVLLPGERGREAPLGAPAVAALRAWLAGPRGRVAGDGRALLTNMAGEKLTRQGIWQIVAQRAEAIGLEASPAVVRASARQHLLDGGMPAGLVRRLFRAHAVLDDELRAAWEGAHPRGAPVETS